MTLQRSEDYNPDWWREYYPAIFPLWEPWGKLMEEGAEREAGFMVQHLDLEPGLPFLDIGCGEGRHSRCLIRRGFQGCALDFFEDRLISGLRRSNAQNLNGPAFIQGDMRLLPFRPYSFGLILLMDTTFGIFDDAINVGLLRGIHQLLAEKGILFMQVLNPRFWRKDKLVKDMGRSKRWPGKLMRRYHFDQSSNLLYDRLWLEDERGKVLHQFPDQILRLYESGEMKALCLQSNFETVKICSAVDWGPPDSPDEFHQDSPEYYVIAK